MALKFCAMFGGAPAGPAPWGWCWLKDMIQERQARSTVVFRVGFSGSGKFVGI